MCEIVCRKKKVCEIKIARQVVSEEGHSILSDLGERERERARKTEVGGEQYHLDNKLDISHQAVDYVDITGSRGHRRHVLGQCKLVVEYRQPSK